MAIHSTGIRPIERGGLTGFGLTLTIHPDQPGSPSLPADSAPEAGFSSSTVSGVTNSNPRLTSAGTPPVDAANCERIAQAADASPSYSEQEGGA